MSGSGGDVTVTSSKPGKKKEEETESSHGKSGGTAPSAPTSISPEKGSHLEYKGTFQNNSRTQGNLIWYGPDGQELGSYKATSGSGSPSYYTIPQGNWTASNYRETSDPTFMRSGTGFKISLGADRYDPLRGRKTSAILIHPARSGGTRGCIGLIGPKGEIIDFQTKISMYLRTYGSIPLKVSFQK
jgi:hypothetical protein